MYSGLSIDNFDDVNYKISGKCIITGEPYEVLANKRGLQQYKDGDYIQVAFPNMTKDDREFLISGISPEGWGQMLRENNSGESEKYDDINFYESDGEDADEVIWGHVTPPLFL